MRVSRIQLKNWKNFKEVDVRLNDRTFLLGVNAAGKSNFLDAFRFMRDVVEHGVGKAVQARGGMKKLRCLYARQESYIRLAFTIDNTWKYGIDLISDKTFPVLIKREYVRKNGEAILRRPDRADKKDRQRATQTALEQVSANEAFREIANFFRSIEYRHILPQVVRDPQGFSAVPVVNDPYGRDIVRHIWATPKKTREARLRRIDKALQIAVPTLSELKVEMDESRGQPHLRAKFQHWRPNGAIQDESSFSDGTLRLIALFWMFLENGGPLLLEEPELSLNEEIVRRLPGLFARLVRGKQGRQVLISTHSYALLEDPGIQPEEILKLESGQDGTIIQGPSDDAQKLMENGLSAAEAVLPEIRQHRMKQLSSLQL
ncbi:ATP-binding protein [Desulfovibrio sp. ZJ369]|uniref:AAA family ATPase n=1 Tax=Desulfovibrio sp. ZJ369 TaxID=2709793 RepID=UPI0013EB9D6C|nr:ATP-binding protein [Desulfovibrio sp. ZJ369]